MSKIPSKMFQDVQESSTAEAVRQVGSSPPDTERVCFFYCVRLNCSDVQLDNLLDFLDEFTSHYAFQKEKGENGIEHYQIMFKLLTKKRRSLVRKLLNDIADNELHFPNGSYCEPARSFLSSKNYCLKDKTRIEGPWTKGFKKKKIWNFPRLYDWQQEIVDQVTKNEADDRTIIYVNKNYKAGKSVLSKYLVVKHDALIVDGNENHILALVAGKPDAKIVVVDGSADNKRIAWSAIEKIKNGCFASHFGTKGTKMVLLDNNVHIIVFSNNKLEKELKNRRIDKERFKIYKDDDDVYGFEEEDQSD